MSIFLIAQLTVTVQELSRATLALTKAATSESVRALISAVTILQGVLYAKFQRTPQDVSLIVNVEAIESAKVHRKTSIFKDIAPVSLDALVIMTQAPAKLTRPYSLARIYRHHATRL